MDAERDFGPGAVNVGPNRNYEREILSKVVLTREALHFIEAHITVDHFSNELNREVCEWILDFWAEYQAAPSARTVREEFPEFKIIEAPEPLAYYIDEMKDRYRYGTLMDAIHEASYPLEAADTEGAIEAIRAGLDRLEQERISATTSAFEDGASVILDGPPEPPAVWGQEDEVLWADGEVFMLAGPTGVGKTTLAQQVILGLMGINDEVLGYPVREAKRVLYITADRPRQAIRAIQRIVNEEHREILRERLRFAQGPPEADFARSPETLLNMVKAADCDTVIVDSLQDVASKLSDDETGSGIKRACGLATAAGVNVMILHHHRKPQNGSKPDKVEDVYGSSIITNSMGSIAMLWGDATSTVVEFRQLKKPSSEVGPFNVTLNLDGTVEIHEGESAPIDLIQSGEAITAQEMATRLFPVPKDERTGQSNVEKARRKLDKLAKDGELTKQEGKKGGQGGGTPTTYTRPS